MYFYRVFTWGWGVHGQLGHHSVEDYHTPTLVERLIGKVSILLIAILLWEYMRFELEYIFPFFCAVFYFSLVLMLIHCRYACTDAMVLYPRRYNSSESPILRCQFRHRLFCVHQQDVAVKINHKQWHVKRKIHEWHKNFNVF